MEDEKGQKNMNIEMIQNIKENRKYRKKEIEKEKKGE